MIAFGDSRLRLPPPLAGHGVEPPGDSSNQDDDDPGSAPRESSSQRAAACSRQAPDRARSGEATAGPDPDAPSEDPEAPEPDDDSMSHGVIITTESEERGPRLRLGLRSARQPPSAPSTGGLSKARGSFEQDNPRAERVRAAFGVLARALAADPVEVVGSARAGPGRWRRWPRAAVAAGFGWAQPDGIVLLSPAAPRFGVFNDYRDRAEALARAVRAPPGVAGQSSPENRSQAACLDTPSAAPIRVQLTPRPRRTST
jgi:hypothetical protein